MSEKQEKFLFVTTRLSALCKSINRNVDYLTYGVSEYGTEIVEIVYDNGYRKKVDVTCDSLKAIVIDVMRYIG